MSERRIGEITRREALKLLGLFGSIALGAGVASQIPDIPYLGNAKPFTLTEKLEDIVAPFFKFISSVREQLAARGRHIAHAMTFPLNKVMADNVARAFQLLNAMKPSGVPISLIDVIDLSNSRGTYPTFPYAQLGPNPSAWGDGACLVSTFFGRAVLPDPRFRITKAKSHPENLYPGAVARYQEQLYYSPKQIGDKVGKIDFGVFYEPYLIPGKINKVDLEFALRDDQGLGPIIFEIYRGGNPIAPDPNIAGRYHGLRAQDVQALPRSYYFLLAHSPVTLPQDSSIEVRNGILIRKINGEEDFRVNIDPNDKGE